MFALKLFAALGCGLIAGVFFAFSSFVMNALAQLPANQGIKAMQAINIKVINPSFMLFFLGAALDCVFLAVFSLLKGNQPGGIYTIAGSLFYLIGTLGVTLAFNVPLNDALAPVKPENAEERHIWQQYLSQWVLWNHLRTIAALTAAALFTLAICS
ncbi:MAG: DUF1772 domain-containing protein [Cyanobacteria bacterium J083]|nr:MAG: DUF1772 domain-containing protein [Cyanobacteria bacterium J083]